MIEVADEFQGAIFNLMSGYYRQSVGCLRNVVESVAMGVHCQILGNASEFDEWRDGNREIRWDSICHQLNQAPAVQPLKEYLRRTGSDSIFDQRNGPYEGGWARQLYARLSKYSHGRPPYTNVGMWRSNGPIYVGRAVASATGLYVEASVLAYTLIKLSRPDFDLPTEARRLFESEVLKLPTTARVPKTARYVYRHLFRGTLKLTR